MEGAKTATTGSRLPAHRATLSQGRQGAGQEAGVWVLTTSSLWAPVSSKGRGTPSQRFLSGPTLWFPMEEWPPDTWRIWSSKGIWNMELLILGEYGAPREYGAGRMTERKKGEKHSWGSPRQETSWQILRPTEGLWLQGPAKGNSGGRWDRKGDCCCYGC